ncbi:MAG: FtsX-like permease family protein [Clostridiales bacterium]|nr:FtsX-like permease family protein [Clostridiales bacterium]
MKLTQAFKMAFAAIISNKMRSFLTMLGIIIGVVAVTLLIGVGQGTTSEVTARIQSMGSNLISATITNTRRLKLYADDVDALRDETQGLVKYLAPVVSSSQTVKFERQTDTVSVTGTIAEYATIRDYSVASGRFIADGDVDGRAYVAVIGSEVADDLYSTQNAVGNDIVIGGRTFTVVGVLESIGESSSGSSSNDLTVIIPLSTAQRLFKDMTIKSIYASAYDESTIDAAKTAIQNFMAGRAGDESAYRVYTQTDLLETVSSVSDTLTLMLGGIASISLLVGGIGIMNIMLVSVTERTREIGIRKAIGAKRLDIVMQFLIESMVLSLLGGIIGLGLSLGGAWLVRSFLAVNVTMTTAVMALAIGFSAVVGVVFGSYPAAKAARLRPIEALRYE